MKNTKLLQKWTRFVFCTLLVGSLAFSGTLLAAGPNAEEKASMNIHPNQEADQEIIDSRTKVAQEVQAVDLTQKPWLVETARLPVNHPALLRERTIWADSFLYYSIDEIVPAIDVEKWLTPLPDLQGKFVLVEMWATWCPPCRRSLPYLNYIAQKYKENLVVVAICETDEEAIAAMPNAPELASLQFSLAVDTGRRFANRLGVWGIPHAVLLEPVYGGVVWEGMPTLPMFTLDDVTLEGFFKQAQQLKEQGKFPEKSPVLFAVSDATEEQRATRRNVGTKDAPDEIGAPAIIERSKP